MLNANGASPTKGSICILNQISPPENILNNETEQAIIDIDRHTNKAACY